MPASLMNPKQFETGHLRLLSLAHEDLCADWEASARVGFYVGVFPAQARRMPTSCLSASVSNDGCRVTGVGFQSLESSGALGWTTENSATSP